MNNTKRGFALVETMIAVAVLAAILVSMAVFVSSRHKAQASEDLIALQAREMALLATAVTDYMESASPSWPLLAPVEITVAQLQAAELLPEGFAVRGGSNGMTPFHQPYAIVGRKQPPGPGGAGDGPQAVIFEGGEIPTARLVRGGIENTRMAIQGLKRSIAFNVHRDYKHPSGVVPAGATVVEGAGGSFTKPLAAFFAGSGVVAATEAVAVTLVGFDDLLPTPPEMPEVDSEQKWGRCNIVTPIKGGWPSAWQPPVCGLDKGVQMTEIQRIPMCGHRFGLPWDAPDWTVYPSDIGAFATKKITTSDVVTLKDGWTATAMGGGPGGGVEYVWSWIHGAYNTSSTREELLLNNEVVGGVHQCSYSGASQGGRAPSASGGWWQCEGHNTPRLPSDPSNELTGVKPCVRQPSVPWPEVVVELQKHAQYLACCSPYEGPGGSP